MALKMSRTEDVQRSQLSQQRAREPRDHAVVCGLGKLETGGLQSELPQQWHVWLFR